MKVRAIAKGFYGNRIRNEDDVFDVPEGTKGSWFIPLAEAKRVSAPAAAEMPMTIEEAKKLTNDELRSFLDAEEIKYPDSATKAELAKMLIDGMTKKAEEDLV